jgi:hypothetical protein
VYGYAVRPAHADPVQIERSPRVYFRGGFAHLVDGQWHYQTESGWMVFVDEPPELVRYRDSVGTEQTPTNGSPRGPTVLQLPGAGGPLALPPPRVK